MSNTDLNKLVDSGFISRDNLKIDSREVIEGDIFVALKGTACDGHDFIGEALARGAAGVICEREVPGLLEADSAKLIKVENVRRALAQAAKRIFEDPSEKLEVYGVTGTNGKTTTIFLIDGILSAAGKNGGLVSTVFTKTSDDAITRSSMTTPDAVTLNRLLSEMVSGGKKAVALEISSHALSQGRTLGIGLDGAVFTNITPEHLDYHGNMENYLRDKSRIFDNLKSGGTGVINLDDPTLKELKGKLNLPRLISYGTSPEADIRAKNIKTGPDGLRFDLVMKDGRGVSISSGLIGRHNVYNMMAAAAVLSGNGISAEDIKKGLESAQAVPGRMDAVRSGAPFKVFVDYAHTPNALENALKCLRSIAGRRLICVFGCGGDRDRAKRPVMGSLASEICDHVIVTSDNPRTEDPEDIIRQIEKGMPDNGKYSIILQRREAIRKALKMADDSDIVIIAGKGHEDYQIIGEKVLHFDDKEVAGEILTELGYD
ncbi:MAG: UDP-N-acetylmuramoyl-L-alanyl-D-glutamate--2,6-diaminopimelate ligase [Candidatus Omnitrophota bacterium]